MSDCYKSFLMPPLSFYTYLAVPRLLVSEWHDGTILKTWWPRLGLYKFSCWKGNKIYNPINPASPMRGAWASSSFTPERLRVNNGQRKDSRTLATNQKSLEVWLLHSNEDERLSQITRSLGPGNWETEEQGHTATLIKQSDNLNIEKLQNRQHSKATLYCKCLLYCKIPTQGSPWKLSYHVLGALKEGMAYSVTADMNFLFKRCNCKSF